MEFKNAFSQLPNALRFQNIVTTNKPTIKHFAMVGHAFHLVTSTTVINPTIDMPSLSPPSNSFAHIQTADVLRELQNLDPLKSAGIFFLNSGSLSINRLLLTSNPTIVSPMCNLASELAEGVPRSHE